MAFSKVQYENKKVLAGVLENKHQAHQHLRSTITTNFALESTITLESTTLKFNDKIQSTIMKAIQILQWAVRQSINFEFLNFVDVPDENDEFMPQTEEWWQNFCGGCPPGPIAAGKYLYFYSDNYDEINYDGEYEKVFEPDAIVEVDGTEIYLYMIEG